MKITLFFNTILFLLFLTSCSDKEEKRESLTQEQSTDKKNKKTNYDVSLTDCIHNALYYLDNTDINHYDSIDTHYFHEVLGYTNKDALKMEKDIQLMKQTILLDTLNNLSRITKDEYQLEIDELRQELFSYEKEIIGFVFIHTYTINQDTLSAIIVMNKNCSSSQAIPVNAIKDIDPSDYSYRVETIENNL